MSRIDAVFKVLFPFYPALVEAKNALAKTAKANPPSASPLVLKRSEPNFSRVYAGQNQGIKLNPLHQGAQSLLSILGALPACGGGGFLESDFSPATVSSLGADLTLTTTPLAAKLDGMAAASGGQGITAVVWSTYDGTSASGSGTFINLLKAGKSEGPSAVRFDDRTKHLNTAVAVLNNGGIAVAYVETTGEADPSRLMLYLQGPNHITFDTEIEILPAEIRSALPAVKLVAQGDKVVAVYTKGGKLFANRYDATGKLEVEAQDLGPAPRLFALSNSVDGKFALAELAVADEDDFETDPKLFRQVAIRIFKDDLAKPVATGAAATGFIAPETNLDIAQATNGNFLAVLTVSHNSGEDLADPNDDSEEPGIQGVYIDAKAKPIDQPFYVRSQSQAKSPSVEPTGDGNFIVTYSEGGILSARSYAGNHEDYASLVGFSDLNLSTASSDVLVSVNPANAELYLSYARQAENPEQSDLVAVPYQLN